MEATSYQFVYTFDPVLRSESSHPVHSLTQYSEFTHCDDTYLYSGVSPGVSSATSASSGVLESQVLMLSPSSSALSNALTFLAPTASAEPDDVVSVSTVFHPDAFPAPDSIFSSSDGVMFYVHSQTILDRCPTAFNEQLGSPLGGQKFGSEVTKLDAPSVELTVIFHTLYGTSAEVHSPDIETLVHAVDRMPSYGLPPKVLIRPSTPLYDLLLSKAPLHPLDVYALAAHHDLPTLATSVSSHLLSFDLFSISDAMAERITAVYLKKLMLLHAGRFKSLKAILLHPPHPHPPTKCCGLEDQKKLTRAWALVSAYLVWDSRPDLSVHRIQSTLNPLIENVGCDLCHQVMNEKVKDVLVRWASVKCTI